MSRIKYWFFQESSVYQLAYLRIVLALLALLIIVRFWPEAALHFSDEGWYPRDAQAWFAPQPYRWAPLFWSGSSSFVQTFFIISIISSLFMILGFCTPVVAPLTWLSILSIRSRNMAITDGTEYVLQVALMFLSFTDSGQVLSLDRRLGLRDTVWKKSLCLFTRSVWPLRVIQLHILIIYFVAGASKLLATQFWDGSFLSIVLMNKNFSRWDFSFLHNSSLAIFISKLISWFVPFWECTLPFFALHKRFFKFAIFSGVCFHLGILIFMKISYFPHAMIACYLTFIPVSYFPNVKKF